MCRARFGIYQTRREIVELRKQLDLAEQEAAAVQRMASDVVESAELQCHAMADNADAFARETEAQIVAREHQAMAREISAEQSALRIQRHVGLARAEIEEIGAATLEDVIEVNELHLKDQWPTRLLPMRCCVGAATVR